MILCDKHCEACCAWCIHVIYEYVEIDGKMVRLEPIACSLHEDEEHKEIVASCHHCEDFHCKNVKVGE